MNSVEEEKFRKEGILPFRFTLKIMLLVVLFTGSVLLAGAVDNGFNLKILFVWLVLIVGITGLLAIILNTKIGNLFEKWLEK